ncbi:MAG: Transcriptional regulator, TrmB [Candidatus Moranbacteria bacterium GW2011_GWE2_35_2-]|nr:MAG: Transcriptional regulator, TrmB [Candidatus Moranbacteria bacterium GW2011_GWE2_35_2-]KKQ06657.1 MAG: Transcriptional regulator, TrmB [Candidatus Moranbacteria bacterium GW2011_GWF1_36_4]KKQ22620.1 MAG: Transcriptional regulator, TrmB [Candidatus Moranbacteria bacterium GW2011_GWF2_37_11]KKQ29023.1 MAG: Transcriptional regulator, TrmB [Candidatus Moranbacteria bacterium GW2011_GWD1_37_17]KKQ30441.1 MAG: Transcriptional regulator, TrmB [Candidatus Moranbacteria bacterium GW2011_GWE1_37_2
MLNRIQKEEAMSGLLQLELSDKEAIVYLSVLENGESTIPSISVNTGLSRGTVYDVTEKLKKKGFIAEIKKGKKRKLLAENPTNRIYSFLDDEHAKFQKVKNIAEKIIPTLKALDQRDNFKPQIKVYEGENGFRKVWDEIFSSKDKNFLSLARIETFIEFAGENFLEEIQKKKVRLGFSSRAINEDSQSAQKLQRIDLKYNRETRFAPKEFQFPSTEIIFGNKIAMFSTKEENIVVVIESRDFAETHRQYFEMMWGMLEK